MVSRGDSIKQAIEKIDFGPTLPASKVHEILSPNKIRLRSGDTRAVIQNPMTGMWVLDNAKNQEKVRAAATKLAALTREREDRLSGPSQITTSTTQAMRARPSNSDAAKALACAQSQRRCTGAFPPTRSSRPLVTRWFLDDGYYTRPARTGPHVRETLTFTKSAHDLVGWVGWG